MLTERVRVGVLGGRFSLRAAGDDDYPALAALLSAIDPHQPHTAETLRHAGPYLERRGSAPVRLVAGGAGGGRGSPPGHGVLVGRGQSPGVHAGVAEDGRRRGRGTALLLELHRRALEPGAREVRTGWVSEADGAAPGFLARHGFRERERAWPSTLELDDDVAPDAPAPLRSRKVPWVVAQRSPPQPHGLWRNDAG